MAAHNIAAASALRRVLKRSGHDLTTPQGRVAAEMELMQDLEARCDAQALRRAAGLHRRTPFGRALWVIANRTVSMRCGRG